MADFADLYDESVVFVRELSAGDEILIISTTEIGSYGNVTSIIPTTVISNVMMRDGSGDYALTVDGWPNGSVSTRVPGEHIYCLPDSELHLKFVEQRESEVAALKAALDADANAGLDGFLRLAAVADELGLDGPDFE